MNNYFLRSLSISFIRVFLLGDLRIFKELDDPLDLPHDESEGILLILFVFWESLDLVLNGRLRVDLRVVEIEHIVGIELAHEGRRKGLTVVDGGLGLDILDEWLGLMGSEKVDVWVDFYLFYILGRLTGLPTVQLQHFLSDLLHAQSGVLGVPVGIEILSLVEFLYFVQFRVVLRRHHLFNVVVLPFFYFIQNFLPDFAILFHY